MARSHSSPSQLWLLAILALAALAFPGGSSASGGVGVYGIIEKVVFEPNEQAAARLQVWGAFAYVDGGADSAGEVSVARRGFLYFTLPADSRLAQTVRTEWKDLKTVAGTGQAVGFGAWGYLGVFGALNPGVRSRILEMYPTGGVQTDLRVREASEPPTNPAVYQTNVGVVKIPAQGSRREVVQRLRQQLQTP